jgi:F420-0:gamma-glutamyl ligase-like protein
MRFVWGCFLCEICHIKESTAVRLRNYPLHEGAKHKQLAIDKVGVLQALRFGSEGGIDVSNLPYSYACLPLTDPVKEAEKIHQAISRETGKSTVIVIADSDKTYSIGNLHVSPTKTAVPNIKCGGGVLTYIFGRGLKLKPSSTPKAIFPPRSLTTVEALKVAELAHRARGCGAGRTAWDMAEKFKVGLTKVTWEMLDSLEHYPIVVVRR